MIFNQFNLGDELFFKKDVITNITLGVKLEKKQITAITFFKGEIYYGFKDCEPPMYQLFPEKDLILVEYLEGFKAKILKALRKDRGEEDDKKM